MIGYLPISRGEGDGINAEVVCRTEDGAEVARVEDFVQHENEGVAPFGIATGYGTRKIILFY